jgi:maleamate amidohydrolase
VVSSEVDRLSTYKDAGFGKPVLRGMSPAIVVVDFTYGFTDPKYPTATDMTDEITSTRKLLDVARCRGVPVFFTAISYSEGEVEALPWLRKSSGMAALLTGTRLVEVDGRLSPAPSEPIVIKHGASAFHGTNLAALLIGRQIDTVIVVGATTSGCVRASVVDAVQNGFSVLVVRDCVADRAQGPHDANLFDIEQKYGDVISINDALDYLDNFNSGDRACLKAGVKSTLI